MTPRGTLPWRPLAIAALACATGCSGARSGSDTPTLWRGDDPGAVARTVIDTLWDTLSVYGMAPNDTLLRFANRIAATSAGLYALNEYTGQLVYFDPRLHVRWVRDVTGGADYRPAAIRDLKTTRDGMALLLNNDRHTLVLIDTTGAVRRRIDVHQAGSAEQLVPMGEHGFILYSMANASRPFALIDSEGRVLARFAFPWTGFAKLSGLVTQGRLATAQNGERRWAFFFGYGDGWFVFDDSIPAAYWGRYVEHTTFPSVYASRLSIHVAPSRGSGQTGVLTDSTLSVLFAGASEGRLRYVDRYSVSNGRYLGSYLLPSEASAITESGGVLYTLSTRTQTPTLLALRTRTLVAERGAKDGEASHRRPHHLSSSSTHLDR